MTPVVTVDDDGLHLRLDALLSDQLNLEGKKWLALWLANQDDLFEYVVKLLAEGFIDEAPDGTYTLWYPGALAQGRALLDSRLDEVAQERIRELQGRLDRATKTAEEWEGAADRLSGLHVLQLKRDESVHVDARTWVEACDRKYTAFREAQS